MRRIVATIIDALFWSIKEQHEERAITGEQGDRAKLVGLVAFLAIGGLIALFMNLKPDVYP